MGLTYSKQKRGALSPVGVAKMIGNGLGNARDYLVRKRENLPTDEANMEVNREEK